MVLNGTNLFTTDASRDEFFRSSMDKAIVSYYVGGDYTTGSIANSVTETTILNYTIPANSVLNGIRIKVLIGVKAEAEDKTCTSTFKIKTGIVGSEAEVINVPIDTDTYDAYHYEYLTIEAVVNDLNWDIEQSVIITCQHSAADTNLTGIGYYSIIEGF